MVRTKERCSDLHRVHRKEEEEAAGDVQEGIGGHIQQSSNI